MTTLSALLTDACGRLKKAGLETARLDAEVLLTHALGISREEVWRNSERLFNEDEIHHYEKLIERREGREPLAYIIGEWEFWSHSFKVTPEVLIPRQETELLVEQLLKVIPPEKKNDPWQGLDLCTGSGILAIIAALEMPASEITGIDISSAALNLARENSLRHGVNKRITWIQSDLFGSLPVDNETGGFDFILCNPPYIATEDCSNLQPEIRLFEPVDALDGGQNGLKFYKKIIESSLDYLKSGGYLVMEIGDDQGQAVKTMLNQSNQFSPVTLHQDYSGRDRVVCAQKELNG